MTLRVIALITPAAAAALATGVFHHALVAAFLNRGRGLLRSHGLEDLAAARLIDLLMIGVAVAIGDAFGAHALAVAWYANIAAFARILDLRHLGDHGHDAADLRDIVTAAMRTAAAILGPRACSGKHQENDDGQ